MKTNFRRTTLLGAAALLFSARSLVAAQAEGSAPARRVLLRESFAEGLAKGSASGNVTIQRLPTDDGNFARIAVSDLSTASWKIASLRLAKADALEVSFRYRSTAAAPGQDRGSWVHVAFLRANGASAGTAAIVCQPTPQWRTTTQAIPAPDGAVECSVQFRMQEQNGRFDVAEVSISAVAGGATTAESAEDRDYAKAHRRLADLAYGNVGNTPVLASPDLTLKAGGQVAPYGFVLPDALCDNPDLIYEVECTLRPRWSSKESKGGNVIFALGNNIAGSEPNSFNLTFWGGNGIISRMNSSEGGARAEIRNPITVNARERYVVRARWSAYEQTLWVNGRAINRSVMPKPFVWGKGRTFLLFGESADRGLLNADVERFALRVYEPRLKVRFAGSPRDLGFFTGAGPHALSLDFATTNGLRLASTLTVRDIQGQPLATLKPAAVTAETHAFTLPPLPFGWYQVMATISGEGAEKQVTLPISLTATAAIRESAQASLYGMTEEWPFGRENFDAATVDAMMFRLAQMGIRWFRAWLAWEFIEEAPGVYYWDGFDQFVAIAERYGIEVYPVLHGGTRPFMMPPPDQPLTHSSMISAGYYLPPDMTLWKNYVRALATRYKGRIRHYQMWNEADTRQFLYPFKAEAYAAWLKETAAVIRAVDPEALLGLGGFCAAYDDTWINRTSHTDNDPAYGLAEWYAQKPQQDYDIVDFHFYSVGGPNQSWDATVPLTGRIRNFLDAHGDGGKPIWNSETSFSSTENPRMVGINGGIFNVPFLSERAQAGRVVQWHVQSKVVGIERNFNYRVRGESGVLHSDLSAKPAYAAHITLANALAGLKYLRTLPFNGNIRAYQFADAKRCVTVLWTMGGSEILAARSAANDPPLVRMDLFGNRVPGEGALALTEEPVYLESAQPPELRELIGLRLPDVVLAGKPYEAQVIVANPFEGELRCVLEAKVAGKSATRAAFAVPGGEERVEVLAIAATGTPLLIDGKLSGAVTHEFLLDVPVLARRALVASGAVPAGFAIAEAAQVRIGGTAIDGQNRVMSESNWKGAGDLSAAGSVTLRDREVTVVVEVTDDAVFPDKSGKSPWDGDGVELFFDLRTAEQKAQASMDGVVQLAVAADGRHQITRNQVLQDLVVRAERSAAGYTVAVSFQLPAHVAGGFGFDVSLNDADSATAGRKVQMVWAGTESNHTSASGYGVVVIQ
jgi:hypothetical protein